MKIKEIKECALELTKEEKKTLYDAYQIIDSIEDLMLENYYTQLDTSIQYYDGDAFCLVKEFLEFLYDDSQKDIMLR